MDLSAGTRLGHYEIERLLGSGGMGVVYQALDARLQRPVAIKCIQPMGSIDVRRHVLQEARSASALSHPNICTIFDVAEHGDHSFIVMEYVDGRPLSDLLSEEPPRPDAALDLSIQITSAIAHAHERNVVHGDLKTANVMISTDGRVKVVDFGLARRQSLGGDTITEAAVTAGTPFAMAPEQLSGGRPDSRSDVWSLGVLLQEVLAGTRPFSGTTMAELMAAILRDRPAPVPPHVSPGARRIIERCLEKDPSRRYQHAGDVLAAMETSGRAKALLSPIEPRATDWLVRPPPALSAVSASQITLIGREDEWAALRTVWERAGAGARQLAFVAGEPGIGKTRLVMEFARSLGSDATVLLGRCDQDALVPHQPFVEALDWYARECPSDVLERQLADIDGAWELAQLIAPIARRVPLVAEPVHSNPEGRRYRLFEAVAALFSEIARVRPLLLVLEDLHWADRPTLLLLRHLVRSSHEARLCIVATYREADLVRNQPAAELIAEMRREQGVTRLDVPGLEASQVREFIAHWIGHDAPEPLTRLVAGNTEGNPFFVSEVLRHLGETGVLARLDAAVDPRVDDLGGLPEGVRDAIGRRLARLSDVCNRTLSLAAVVGREFSLPILTTLAEDSEDRLLDVLDEALAARLVHGVPGSPDRYAFTHALLRETLYERLAPARRARLHRQVAEALDRLTTGGDRPLADLAHHYAKGASPEDARKAVECAVAAAERAAASFALEEAARFYDIALRALDRLPGEPGLDERRFDLHFRRGRAFADIGLWLPARTEFESALRLVDPAHAIRRTEVLLELCKCSFWGLDVPALRRYSEEVLPLAESLGRDDFVADAMSWFAGVANAEGDVQACVEMDRQAIARIGGARTFGLARASLSLYHIGATGEALVRAHESLESARESSDPNFRVYALQHLGICLAGVGRYDEAIRTFEEMRAFARRHGVLPMLARGLAMFGGVHLTLGDYARAEELAHEARELARRVSFPPPIISAGIDLLTIFARSHDPGRAEAIMADVARSVAAAGGWHGWLWRLRLNQVNAELALARHDWSAAIEAATAGVTESQARTRLKYVALGLATRAQANRAAGDLAGATHDAAHALETARTVGDPAVLLRALSAQLGVNGSDELLAEARECHARILSSLESTGLRERFLASDLSALPS